MNERKVKLILGVIIILIWFTLGAFEIISGEVFSTGLIGFLIGSFLMKTSEEKQDE